MPDPTAVRSMFARISGRYDLLNRTLSLGIDQRWRRRVVERAGAVRGRIVVDACCGTGDLALAFARKGAKVLGVDFTPEMLRRAGPKRRPGRGGLLFAQGDALRLPVSDDAADVCSVAFGIRNVADRRQGLLEMKRVVRAGGSVLVLEFSEPVSPPFRAMYRLYFTKLLPRLGSLVSGDGEAYEYLPRTVLAWPDPDTFQGEMEDVGLVSCGYERLTQGIVCLHWGSVPGGSPS